MEVEGTSKRVKNPETTFEDFGALGKGAHSIRERPAALGDGRGDARVVISIEGPSNRLSTVYIDYRYRRDSAEET
jgi:hypothetical protein